MRLDSAFRRFTTALLVILSLSCQKPAPVTETPTHEDRSPTDSPVTYSEQANGGGGSQDGGGGGEINLSSSEEVIVAIQATREFLLSEKGHRFLTIHLPTVATKKNEVLISALEKIINPKSWAEKNQHQPIEHSSLKAYLSLSEVEFFRGDTVDKNCSQRADKPYPDAYVDESKYGARVCFNIQRLRRLTQDSLSDHLIALWMHEIAHLNGYGESTAAAVGDFVLSALIQLNRPSIASLLDAYFDTLSRIRLRLLRIIVNFPKTQSMVQDQLADIELYLKSLGGLEDLIKDFDRVYGADIRLPMLEVETKAVVLQRKRARLIVTDHRSGLTKEGSVISQDSKEYEAITNAYKCLLKSVLDLHEALEPVLVPNLGRDELRQKLHSQNLNCDYPNLENTFIVFED